MQQKLRNEKGKIQNSENNKEKNTKTYKEVLK